MQKTNAGERRFERQGKLFPPLPAPMTVRTGGKRAVIVVEQVRVGLDPAFNLGFANTSTLRANGGSGKFPPV